MFDFTTKQFSLTHITKWLSTNKKIPFLVKLYFVDSIQ